MGAHVFSNSEKSQVLKQNKTKWSQQNTLIMIHSHKAKG